MSRPAAITSSLLGLGAIAFTTAIALPFDDRIEFRANNRIDSKPAWLVPQKSEFLGLQRGYGGLKIFAAFTGTVIMGRAMLLARSQATREPIRQRIRQYHNQAEEFEAAAASAYQMALTQQRYKTLIDAEQVAFEGQIETAYLESMGVNPAEQKALPGTTLDQTTNPSDKVREVEVKPAIANSTPASTPDTSTKWEKQFISQTALIWGNQGGGKSWMARRLAQLKKQQGYRVIVLDPDSNRSEWLGIESHHTFEDIEKTIRWYVKELENRYWEFNRSNMREDTWRSQLWSEGKAIALITEEMTTYTNFIRDKELLSKFVRLGLTKSRKQEMPITFVAHNNTQSCLGDITGLKNLIDRMLQLQCLATVDPVTLQPRSSGKGKAKLDGSSEWLDVSLPRIGTKITDFRTESTPAQEQPQIDTDYLERLYNLEFEVKRPDSLADKSDLSDESKPLSDKVSGFVWSVRKVREFYPDTTPEQLFLSLSHSPI